MTIKKLHDFPHRITLRPYQQEVWEAFRMGIKRFVNVWHRRAGKDKCWFNLMIAASQQTVGNYIYCLPAIKHAKKVIWDAIDPRTGNKFLDHIPADLIEGKNNSELLIHLKNGSTIQLLGADNYDSLVGANPIGIVLSEYALSHPLSWEYLQPILMENGGWVAFIFTPRGNNHAAKLYENNLNNPDWFVNKLTIDNTKEWDGTPCMASEAVEKLQKEGNMSKQTAQQEFYCSFAAALSGAYWADEMDKLVDKGNICDFYVDPTIPVETYWDLGFGDSTAIWYVQKKGNGMWDVIGYYENRSQKAAHYVQHNKDFASTHDIIYAEHYLPHDSKHHSFQTGETTADYLRGFKLKITELDRPQSKRDSIEAARLMIPRCRFHATNCATGIESLKSYRASYYERRDVYGDPLHDWSSHGADAFQYFALNELEQEYTQTKYAPACIIQNAVNNDEV